MRLQNSENLTNKILMYVSLISLHQWNIYTRLWAAYWKIDAQVPCSELQF